MARRYEEGSEEDYDEEIEYEEDIYGEEPDFSDPEDFVDEIDDEELMPDLLRTKPKESDGVDSVIVVDGIPKIDKAKLEKLRTVLQKVFGKCGKVINEHYPIDAETGMTKGYGFLEFDSHNAAVDAIKKYQNYKLDKAHTLICNLFSDFDKYLNIPDEWEPPKEEPYEDQGNLKTWLLEPDSCDQFSVIYDGGEKVGVFCNTKPEITELETRPRWTETTTNWSPSGTFFLTIHPRGAALWGGEKFIRIQRFSHPGVQFVDFSPCEKYLVTFSPASANPRSSMAAGPGEEPTAIIIWETRTGLKKRAFNVEGPRPVWPLFQWSSDDKFFARMSAENTLQVYETSSFRLLDSKSIKVNGLREFTWSPTDNILAYWVAEDKDVPARVTLLEIPSKAEKRVKNLFNVADCKMHWQKNGDFLCVKVDRYSKLKREKEDNTTMKFAGIYYNFEIFHMREKEIPVDSVEIKEPVHDFAWEPVGSKFGVVHGEGEGTASLSVSFYEVKSGQTHTAPQEIKKYERKTANRILWSPHGQFVVLAGLRPMAGVLEFIDTNDFTTMNSGEHYMCTDIDWDPTGRYFMTGVSWWGYKVDNAYWIWSFQGKVVKRVPIEKFCNFKWRPRPGSLLTKKQVKEIKKNLKKYSSEFEQKDLMRQSKASKEIIEKRRANYNEFMEWRNGCIDRWNTQKEKRVSLRRGVDTDKTDTTTDGDMEEEVVEFLVKEEETVIE